MLRQRISILTIMAVLALGVWIYPALAHDQAHDQARWVAGVPNRTTVLCIASSSNIQVNSEVMTKVNAAFERVKQHRFFNDAGLNVGGGRQVIAGCPTVATLNTPHWGRLTVNRPGAVQTYVFIVSRDELQGNQFKHYPRVVGHEQMCSEQVCNSVSNAVYITPEELDNRETLVQALTAGLGLPLAAEAQSGYVNGVTPDDKSQK